MLTFLFKSTILYSQKILKQQITVGFLLLWTFASLVFATISHFALQSGRADIRYLYLYWGTVSNFVLWLLLIIVIKTPVNSEEDENEKPN